MMDINLKGLGTVSVQSRNRQYLNVITTQSIALTNERTALRIRGQQWRAAISLIKALGGG